MRQKWIGLTLILLLLTGCIANQQTRPKDQEARPQTISHSKPSPMQSRGRVLPDERGDYNLPSQNNKPMIQSIGYLEATDPKRAVQDLNETARYLTYTAFFSYQVKSDGNLIPIQDDPPLHASKKNGAVPMLVITNFANGNFQPDIAHSIFTDQKAFRRLTQNILTVMKTKGYRAINIDFEHIAEEDRELYNQFLAKLFPILKREGYIVSTALAPKSSDQQGGAWHGAHDYAFHGKIADFVILMTYEWGWTGGPPMAVSPIPQVRKVLDYAVDKIPRHKIVMGAPLYGYDWTLPYRKGGPPAKRVSPQEAETFARSHSIEVKYHNRDQAPYYTYTDSQGKKHVVWYENEQSIHAKFQLIKEYGLRGIAYWVLGEDFPANWRGLHQNFHIQKFSTYHSGSKIEPESFLSVPFL